MAQFDKQKVNIASSNHSKLDVSSTHVTTSSWMTLQPVYYRHMMPREHIAGSATALTRLAPVAVPTYGRCRINLRSFFVPFRTIFPNFNEFVTDTIGTNVNGSSLVAGSPLLPMSALRDLFTNGTYAIFGTSLAVLVSGQGYWDFQHDSHKYRLTFYGRHMMKVLQSLGYRVNFAAKDASENFNYSALPLLAYAKVYCDWYFNQAYIDAQSYLAIQQLFKYNDPSSSLVLTSGDVFNILSVCYSVFYDNGNDVYINAWDNPMSPNNNLYSPIIGQDVSAFSINPNIHTNNFGYVVQLDVNGTPYMSQSSSSNSSIGTEYLHDFLKSATDYVKRNQLSGALQIDRFLSRFGVSLDSAKANRSIYVSSQSIDVDFGSVMSYANTAGDGNTSNLGDYAGQGLGRGEFGFDFSTDEFGLFVVMSSIIPAASLYQGYDRNNLHIDKLDFFTPEFDNLGVQAITKGEVYVSDNHDANSSYDANSQAYLNTFGFAPRYYEYKQKSDFVTGDFVFGNFVGGDAWHLNRILDDNTFGAITTQVHSIDFTRGLSDVGQFNRIFNYTEPDIDQFYIVYHFAAQSLAPCKSLFDTYDFDDAGDVIKMNGNNAKVN